MLLTVTHLPNIKHKTPYQAKTWKLVIKLIGLLKQTQTDYVHSYYSIGKQALPLVFHSIVWPKKAPAFQDCSMLHFFANCAWRVVFFQVTRRNRNRSLPVPILSFRYPVYCQCVQINFFIICRWIIWFFDYFGRSAVLHDIFLQCPALPGCLHLQ